MNKADFDKFVTEQQARLKDLPPFDAQIRLDEWKRNVDSLYSDIVSFLDEYIKRDLASVVFTTVNLHEDLIGNYSLRQMTVRIGASAITFKPAGTIVVGSRGRVDAIGPNGVLRLVLIDKNITFPGELGSVRVVAPGHPNLTPLIVDNASGVEWVWKIATPPPDIRFITLTQDTFFDMILMIVNA